MGAWQCGKGHRGALARASAYPGASGELFAELGFFEAQTGRYEAAITAERQAVRRSPKLAVGWQNLALNLLHQKQAGAALDMLRQAVGETNVDVEFHLVIAETLVGLDREYPVKKNEADALALESLALADQLTPQDPQAWLRLADGFNLLGKTRRAADIYSQLLGQAGAQPGTEKEPSRTAH